MSVVITPPDVVDVRITPPDVVDVRITPPQVLRVTLGAQQGLAGPPGASNAAASYVASGAISGHVVVAETAPGVVTPADPTDLGHVLRVVGVTTHAAVDGAQVLVRSARTLEHGGWTFTPGARVYVGASGALAQTPTPAAVFSQIVGVALTPTIVLLSIQPPIIH